MKSDSSVPRAEVPAICVLKKLSARNWLKSADPTDELFKDIGKDSWKRVAALMDEFAECVLMDAAALEMLEALKSIRTLGAYMYPRTENSSTTTTRIITIAQNAIAKAEGR